MYLHRVYTQITVRRAAIIREIYDHEPSRRDRNNTSGQGDCCRHRRDPPICLIVPSAASSSRRSWPIHFSFLAISALAVLKRQEMFLASCSFSSRKSFS